MLGDAIALGWRVHAWSAVVVAVTGSPESPTVLRRDEVALIDDPALREPYHVAVGLSRDEVPAFIAHVEDAAASAAASAISGWVSDLGAVAAVGVVGGDRGRPTDLAKILAAHARLHAAERDLYECAVIAGATRVGLPVTTIPATGKLFAQASDALGVAVEPSLAALGKSIGPPWQKGHREATAAALVALAALPSR